jgi:pantoate--beta-alanine ligase
MTNMHVAADVADIRGRRATAPGPVGLVPTMGALHAGHLALIADARARCATVIVSVFVNPLQFGPTEDLASYPRDLPGDLDKLREAGVDMVFTPAAGAFTPHDLATTVSVSGVTEMLEGASRPGHFGGVATIVIKLLHVAQPDVAFFGEKDYQQLIVIRRMVTDLDLPVEIVGMPIVRDPDGLALSSRNVYLSADERLRALAVPEALRRAARTWTGDADAARSMLRSALEAAGGVDVDYAEVVDDQTLEPLRGTDHRRGRALVAVKVGTTRLIDNSLLALRASRDGPGSLRASRDGPGSLPATHNGLELEAQ